MKINKTALRISLISLLVAILILIGAGFYMLSYALQPQHRGLNIEDSYTDMYARYPFLEGWVDSLNNKQALRDTFLINTEGKKLHALYIDAAVPTTKTAVIVHGYTDNAVRMLMIGYLYNKNLGYNVLLPDLQFHGLSQGDAIQMGWKDRLDVQQWIDLVINKYGVDTQLAVHGISMGAATTMMLSGEKQPIQVKCFVEDCGYTSVWDEFSQEINTEFGLPPFPLLHVASVLSKLKFGWSFTQASALKAVSRCKLPMLFIHGDADTFVPTWMVYQLYEAKPEPKELWVVPGVIHAQSYLKEPKAYTQHIEDFLMKYIH